MKNFVTCIVICCFSLLFFSCNSNQKRKNELPINATEKENGRAENNNSLQNTNVIGPFHWGINDDAFCKMLTDWTKQLTKNGFVTIAGMKVKSNGIIPHYDKEEHLDKITIEFQKFKIHPEQDYTEEEKSQIEQITLNQSKKIKQLIDSFSDIYGDPIDSHFEENTVEIYSFNGVKTVAQWKSKETHVSLNIQNKTFSGMTGCEMEMWVELEKLN
jgi:hypothetical protein